MVEVPQEDFSIKNFRELSEELFLRVVRPDPIYEQQKWMNPKLAMKFSSIEDFVDELPD